jgi:hypothetical protein
MLTRPRRRLTCCRPAREVRRRPLPHDEHDGKDDDAADGRRGPTWAVKTQALDGA